MIVTVFVMQTSACSELLPVVNCFFVSKHVYVMCQIVYSVRITVTQNYAPFIERVVSLAHNHTHSETCDCNQDVTI